MVGCSHSNPSLNSFQATISSQKIPSIQTNQTEPPREIPNNKIIILVHGIYGDSDTFGNLSHFLLDDPDIGIQSVYVTEYWSSRFFPNFQRLADLGVELEQLLDTVATAHPRSEVVVIAHSQGGLIARSAILKLKENGRTDILNRMKLVMIGTPNYASLYATYNNLLVNSLFAGITYGTTLVTGGLTPPLVYNRQAYDMGYAKLDIPGGADRISPFMENMLLRWGKAFPAGTNINPKVYAIVGVRNLFDHFDLSDGVVHSLNTLSVGLPSTRVYYVPYKHFGSEATIEDNSHQSYAAIKKILREGNGQVSSEQRLSPFSDFLISQVMFVEQEAKGAPKLSVTQFSTSLKLQPEKSVATKGKEVVRRINRDPSGQLLRTAFQLTIFPFELLQAFIIVPVTVWDKRHAPEPQWNMLRLPQEILEGEYEGTIQISRPQKGKGWLGGLWERTEHAYINFGITNISSKEETQCRVEYPIDWGNANKADEAATDSLWRAKLTISPNSVNVIRVATMHHEITQQDLLILTTGKCISEE